MSVKSTMLTEWLNRFIPCKYCASGEFNIEYRGKTLIRPALLCKTCGRNLAWIPNNLVDELKESNK